MARGNWQRRVEIADARRKEAKQRKQKVTDIRSYKQYANDLVEYCYNNSGSEEDSSSSICLFVDKKPPPDAMMLTAEDDYSEDAIKTMKQRRGRSNSTASQDGKNSSSAGTPKKVHPRSRKNSITKEEDVMMMDGHHATSANTTTTASSDPSAVTMVTMMMCRHHFFTAKCNVKQCAFPHLTSICGLVQPECLDDLIHSFSESETEQLYMPALYCLKLHHISELFTTAEYNNNNIKASDIVYAVDEKSKILLYDRHREGLLVGKKKSSVMATTTNQQHQPRAEYSHDDNNPVYSTVASTLPALLLRYVIEYLPDNAVASMSAVCHDWYVALSPTNQLVWQFLLTRNGWPGTTYDDYSSHASVVRDITSWQMQMQQQHSSHHGSAVSTEESPLSIVLVTAWQPNQVLVIDSAASAILYDGSPPIRRPKILLRASLDPYCNTKKRTINVVAAALDDTTIGLLAQVKSVNVEAIASILILKQRDAFLLNDNDNNNDDDDENGGTHVIDIGTALLNYLLSLDVADHRMLQLMDFLQTHDFGEVQIVASPALAACGHGRFLCHVHIWIPTNVPDMDPDMFMMIDRRMVLFSADAVLWMGDSNDKSIHSLQYEPRNTHQVAMCSDRGIVVTQLMDGAPPTSIDSKQVRKVLISRTHIVSYSVFQLTPMDSLKTELRFHDRSDHNELELEQPPAPDLQVLPLTNNMYIIDISCVRGDHLVVLCDEGTENPERIDDALGHRSNEFFLPRNEGTTLKALIIHVPTQVIIRCIELTMHENPRMMDYAEQTLVLYADNNAIWMSGLDVLDARAQHEEEANRHNNNNHSAKKKKKRKPQRGGKKDGFARGISLRG
jgi:hypothetical protein